MDKTFNWINAKGMHITLTAKIESSRWIDVRYTASSPDFPDNLEFSGEYHFVPDTLQLHNRYKRLMLAVPSAVKTELEAAIRQEFEANGFELEVNSTDCYGTDNGISSSALSYLEDYVGIPYSRGDRAKWQFEHSFNSRFGIDGVQFVPKSDSVNYRAFPIYENWSDEWKSYLTEAAKKMKAPGCILVPADELIAAYWETLAEVELPELLARIAHNEKCIAMYSGLTDQQARAREEWYNNAVNDGGEGFVPHYVGSEERDRYISENAKLRARIERIENRR